MKLIWSCTSRRSYNYLYIKFEYLMLLFDIFDIYSMDNELNKMTSMSSNVLKLEEQQYHNQQHIQNWWTRYLESLTLTFSKCKITMKFKFKMFDQMPLIAIKSNDDIELKNFVFHFEVMYYTTKCPILHDQVIIT